MQLLRVTLPADTHTVSIVPVPGLTILGATIEIDNVPTSIAALPDARTNIVAIHAPNLPPGAVLAVALMPNCDVDLVQPIDELLVTCDRDHGGSLDIACPIDLPIAPRILERRNGFGPCTWTDNDQTFRTDLQLANDGFSVAEVDVTITLPPTAWTEQSQFRRKATSDAVVLTTPATIRQRDQIVYPLVITATSPSVTSFPVKASILVHHADGRTDEHVFETVAQRTVDAQASLTLEYANASQPRSNGEVLPVTVTIENGAVALEECTLEIHGADIDTVPMSIGNLFACEQRQLTAYLRILPSGGGSYQSVFSAVLQAKNGFQCKTSEEMAIVALPNLTVSVTPKPILDNGVTPIYVAISNDGDGTAHDVVVKAEGANPIVEALVDPINTNGPAQPLPLGSGPFAKGFPMGHIARNRTVVATMLLAPYDSGKPEAELSFATTAKELSMPVLTRLTIDLAPANGEPSTKFECDTQSRAVDLPATDAAALESAPATNNSQENIKVPAQAPGPVPEIDTAVSTTAPMDAAPNDPAADKGAGDDVARMVAPVVAGDLVYPRFSLPSDRLLECFAPSPSTLTDESSDGDAFDAPWITAGHVGLALLAYLPTYDSRANDELTRLQTELQRTLDSLVPRMLKRTWGLTNDILFDLPFQTAAKAYLHAIGGMPVAGISDDIEATIMIGLLDQVDCSDEIAATHIAEIRSVYRSAIDRESPAWGLPLSASSLGAIYDILYRSSTVAA